MFKVFRIVLITAFAVGLVASMLSAQDKGLGEKAIEPVHYFVGVNPPVMDPPGNGWTAGFPASIANSATVWFAAENTYVPENYKEFWLRLYGPQAFKLTADSAIGSSDSTVIVLVPHISEIGKSTTPDSAGVEFHVLFQPQPEWELIRVRNNSGGTIALTGAQAERKCSRIDRLPSLTNWGLLVLLALLILSGVIVIRQRRRGVARV